MTERTTINSLVEHQSRKQSANLEFIQCRIDLQIPHDVSGMVGDGLGMCGSDDNCVAYLNENREHQRANAVDVPDHLLRKTAA